MTLRSTLRAVRRDDGGAASLILPDRPATAQGVEIERPGSGAGSTRAGVSRREVDCSEAPRPRLMPKYERVGPRRSRCHISIRLALTIAELFQRGDQCAPYRLAASRRRQRSLRDRLAEVQATVCPPAHPALPRKALADRGSPMSSRPTSSRVRQLSRNDDTRPPHRLFQLTAPSRAR